MKDDGSGRDSPITYQLSWWRVTWRSLVFLSSCLLVDWSCLFLCESLLSTIPLFPLFHYCLYSTIPTIPTISSLTRAPLRMSKTNGKATGRTCFTNTCVCERVSSHSLLTLSHYLKKIVKDPIITTDHLHISNKGSTDSHISLFNRKSAVWLKVAPTHIFMFFGSYTCLLPKLVVERTQQLPCLDTRKAEEIWYLQKKWLYTIMRVLVLQLVIEYL